MKPSASLESLTSIDDMLKPVEDYIKTKQPPRVLDYVQIRDFLENVWGSPDPRSVALLYTDKVSLLIDQLTEIYPLLTSRKMKARITRIKKKIQQKENEEDSSSNHCSDTDESSQQSSF